MADIRIIQDTRFPAVSVGLDWIILNGTLDQTQALASAVIMALGTDRLADESEILPDLDSTNRRGWWGDLDADTIWGGWPIGSRLWLLERAKITDIGSSEGATTVRAENYIREAIGPFITAGIASAMDVSVIRNPYNRYRIDCAITLYRGPKEAINLQFALLWDQQAVGK